MNVKLYRALREGRIVHVAEVGRGLACDCACPLCGSRLLAKQGPVKAWHFAHYKAPECDLVVAGETAIHRAVKEIIGAGDEFSLPSVLAYATKQDRWGRIHRMEDASAPIQGIPEDVRCEVSIGDIRPDIVAKMLGHELLIEVAVTHPVDRDKKSKIRRAGLPCIEINLRDAPRDIPTSELRALVLSEVENKRWIYNRWAQRRHRELSQALAEYIEEVNAGEDPTKPAPLRTPPPQIGVCVFCGTETEDWWWYDSKTDECKCRPCYRQGRS